MGGYFKSQLVDLSRKFGFIKEVRGQGLMLGMEIEFPCKQFVTDALAEGLLINVTHEKVVRMLPPGNVKVRFFVPQDVVGSLAAGRALAVRCDGCASEVAATITFVSSQAEFTPPVIYSREERSKFVFRVEARPAEPGRLRVGQPVTVRYLPPDHPVETSRAGR